jgi:hypothetical protein
LGAGVREDVVGEVAAFVGPPRVNIIVPRIAAPPSVAASTILGLGHLMASCS